MNKSTTTFKKAITSVTLAGIAFVVAFFAVPINVKADSYDDQIRAIEAEISNFRAQAGEARKRADGFQAEIDVLSAQKAEIQAQIDLNQVKYDQLVARIAETEAKITKMRGVLGDVLADIYVDSDISPLEMIATSKSMSDYMDKQQYQNTVRNKLNTAIKEIKELKVQLSEQKIGVERILNDQKARRQTLVDKENEQASLLAAAQNEASSYNNLVESRNAQVASLRARQAAAYQQYGNGSNSPTGLAITYKNMTPQSCYNSGYSYCDYGWDDIVDDPWGLGYTKECVHYAADTLARRGYYIPYKLFAGRGNAYQWTSTASGVATINRTPAVNAVVYMPIGGLGHVGIVEEVYGNGWVRVSQMNLPFGGYYSTMDLQVTSNIQFLHFSR